MNEGNLTGTLLEQDVRRAEADKTSNKQSKPLDDVIAVAREEIAAVFAKKLSKPVDASR